MDEHQQDANSALMELDKGLRSHKVGEQCEAIVRFPSLFATYPFPILINSAFLKLADAFRTGNNFMRICVMKVAQQSTKHLDKILNVDEFMKRIYVVIHSNDPYARALTLRMFGSVACIICEKKSAHHSIQQGLDSHDRVEQDAAIFATIQFASHSHDFASSICNKISAMLKGLSTPLEIKLKLIPVMQHMHYNVQISMKARSILQDLLPSYPAQDFVLTTLNALTQLALHSLIAIPEQVTLLLQYLRCDPREAVKMDSLQNLNILARRASHLWTMQDSSALCKAFQLSTLSMSLKRGIIRVLCTLTESGSLIEIDIQEGGPLLQLCRQCCYDIDVIQAALATKLFSAVAQHATRANVQHQAIFCDEVLDATEVLLLILAPSSVENAVDAKALKIILPSLRQMCSYSTHTDIRLIKTLITLLTSHNEEIPINSEICEILLETIVGIVFVSHAPSLLSTYVSKLFGLLRSILVKASDSDVSSHRQAIVALLCTLIFLANQEKGKSSYKRLVDQIKSSDLDHWTLYRIARQASRMGQHATAHQLFFLISGSVASEQHYFWLIGLADISFAESIMCEHFCDSKAGIDKLQHSIQLTKVIHHYHKAVTSLTAAVTPNHGLNFQCSYARLRRETLQAHVLLSQACSLVRTCPPPAISAIVSKLEGTSSGMSHAPDGSILLSQMNACADWFLSVATGYGELHMTSFDSDPSTLSNIDILQQSCSIMAYAIDILILSRSMGQGSVALRNGSLESSSESKDDDHFTRALKKVFASVMTNLEDVLRKDNLSQPLSHMHTDCLLQCSSLLLSVPQSFPRYFYQSLQTTIIKLAVSPNHHGANEPVSVEVNQKLALKVEGVIQHQNTQSSDGVTANIEQATSEFKTKFRSVGKIKLHLKKGKQEHSKTTNIKNEERFCVLEQIVEPHNDYFSTQFLVGFSTTGICNVVIDTSVQDDDGIWWKTGPQETILIKCYDDSARLQQQSGRSGQNR